MDTSSSNRIVVSPSRIFVAAVMALYNLAASSSSLRDSSKHPAGSRK